MNSKQNKETPGRNTEEKKKVDSSEKPIYKTETNESHQYQEGTPTKTDSASKVIASDLTESQHFVEERKKKWHSPPIVPPHIQGDKYHNPFDLKALEKQTKEKGSEAFPPYEEMKINSKNSSNGKAREAKAKEGNEYDSNSFEAEDSPGHEYNPHEEEAIKNEIRTLGKKERDILRESLSNMKQEMENNKKGEEIPEEIASEGPESKVEAIEPIKENKSTIEILEKNEHKPKAKIVCQALFANSVPFGSQPGMRPHKAEISGNGQKEEKKEMWSSPSKTFQAFLERLQKLDSEKISKLAKALDVIESESKLAGAQKGQVMTSLEQPHISRAEELPNARKSTQEKHTSENQVKEKDLVEQEDKEAKGKPPTKRDELIFRIISTWGHPHVAGLTEIALFDKNGKTMAAPVKAKNLGAGAPQSISKLTNGKIYTNDERSMWVAYLPLNPKYLELVFTLPQGFGELGGVVVWNYNKNSIDSTKGVKEASLIFNRHVIWTGILKKGYGRLNEDYSTEIFLCENKDVFKEKPRFYASESEKAMPKDLLKRKREQENGSSRPISVPTWLDDYQTDNSIAIKKPEERKQTLEQHSTEYTYSRATESIHGQRREYFIPKSKPKGYPFYSNNSGITSAKEAKRVRGHEVELKPAFNNRRKQNTIQDQRDQSMERHIDNLIYFEASKPTRLLKKKQEQKKESQRRRLETKDSDRVFPTPQKETAHKNETKSSPRTEPVTKAKHPIR